MRGSVNAGVTPRVGPPPPTIAPVPPSPGGGAGAAAFGGSAGSVVGTLDGASIGAAGAALFTRRLSPPERCFAPVSAAERT
jgi:hypothetical protein